MKKVIIKKREITELTKFKKYRFKKVLQFIITVGTETILKDVESEERLKKDFQVVLNTRKKKELESYIKTLGRTEKEKEVKILLNKILLRNYSKNLKEVKSSTNS